MTAYILHAETRGVSLDLALMSPRGWSQMSEVERDEYMLFRAADELQRRGLRPRRIEFDYCAIVQS